MWYLFGVIALKKKEFSEKTISFKNIAIIAKEIDSWDLDKSNKVVLLNELLSYQKTLEKIMQQQLVIPIKFGTVVNSLEDIQIILTKNHALFQKILKEMEGKVEISLAGSWDEQEQVKEISKEDKEICKMKTEAQKNPDLNSLIKIGKALASRLEERRTKFSAEIFKKLEPLTISKVDHEKLEDKMLINSSFLISQENEERFVECLSQFEEKVQNKIQFKYISPLPPHSFRSVHIQKLSSRQLTEVLELFEIGENTTFEELKNKNRELILKFHPDTEGKNRESDFSRVHEAFNLLKNFYHEKEKPFVNLDKEHCFLTTIADGSLHNIGE
ncbi:MAG: GvpL/GvpF family gas vesicle protein [Chlamydiota bacterium]